MEDKIPAGDLMFHCSPEQGAAPTHTLVFHRDGNDMLMSYSRAHPGLDAFSKKEGRRIAEDRMGKLKFRLSDEKYKNRIIAELIADDVFAVMPEAVAETVPHYLGKAMRYFKVDDTSKGQLIFRSDKRANRVVSVSLLEMENVINSLKEDDE